MPTLEMECLPIGWSIFAFCFRFLFWYGFYCICDSGNVQHSSHHHTRKYKQQITKQRIKKASFPPFVEKISQLHVTSKTNNTPTAVIKSKRHTPVLVTKFSFFYWQIIHQYFVNFQFIDSFIICYVIYSTSDRNLHTCQTTINNDS